MSKTERILFLTLGIFVWVYIGIRSAYVPLVHDEVATYFAYIRDATFIPPWSYWDANNHILNSASSAILTIILGNSAFAIRMASWLSFLPLLYFVYRISQNFKPTISKWAFIIPILTTPFLIEFFGLTRGYGMSIAWFIGVIYWSIKYAKTPSRKALIWISALGLLSVLSSLSVIVSVFIIYGWILLHQIFILHKSFSSTLLRWFSLFILPQTPIIYYVFLLKEKGLLYHGGDDFIKYSLAPFARYFFNDSTLWWVVIIPFSLLVISLLIQLFKSGWKSILEAKNIFTFVLTLSLIAVFTQHFLLGVNYPEDRAALYFFPLLIGAWASIPTFNIPYLKPILMVTLLWFPLDLVLSLNTTHTKLWPQLHIPYRFTEKVNSAEQEGYPPTISTYFLFTYIWDFNQFDDESIHSTANIIDFPSEWSDFVLIDSNRIKEFDTLSYLSIDFDPNSGNRLLKRAIPNIETLKKDTLIQDLKIESTYSNIFEFDGASWGQNPMALYYDLEINASSNHMHLLIISSLFDTDGNEIFSAQCNLNQVSDDWKTHQNQKVKLYLPPFPENSGRFVTYVFNPENESHKFAKLKCSLAEISHP